MPAPRCHRCNGLLDDRAVPVYQRPDGTDGLWTPGREARTVQRGLPLPRLYQMCPDCYIVEQNRALERGH